MIPSGKLLHNYGKSPCSMGKPTISMAIFNSYVSLPEGTPHNVLLVKIEGPIWYTSIPSIIIYLLLKG